MKKTESLQTGKLSADQAPNSPISRHHDPQDSGFRASEYERNKVRNTKESAAFTGYSIPHFRRLYRTGGVPAPIQLGARKLGWRTGDLIDWVATRQTRPVVGEVRDA